MQALPQNRVHHPQKNKHDYPENLKTGIEITRRAVGLPGFVQRRLKMGIKIELTDDEIVEPSGGIAMFDLPGREFPGNEDALFDLRRPIG